MSLLTFFASVGASTPTISDTYVTEDGLDNYVTEDAANNYVTSAAAMVAMVGQSIGLLLSLTYAA
jgi:hypothetical protein